MGLGRGHRARVIRLRSRGEITIRGGHAAVPEEAIMSAWRVENEEARGLRNDQERVRRPARDRDGLPRHRIELLPRDVETQLALEHVEGLVARIGVQAGGSPLCRDDLDEREGIVAPVAGHLDVLEGAVEPQRVALAGRDDARRSSSGVGDAHR